MAQLAPDKVTATAPLTPNDKVTATAQPVPHDKDKATTQLLDATKKELDVLAGYILRSAQFAINDIPDAFWFMIARKSKQFSKKILKACRSSLSGDFAKITLMANKRNALHEAAECDNVTLASFLLQHSVDVGVRDEAGNTPLHMAATRRSSDVFFTLLQFYDDVNIVNKSHKTVLHILCDSLNVKAIAVLLARKGVLVGKQDERGLTALHTYVHRLTGVQVSQEMLAVLKLLCGACEDQQCLDQPDNDQFTAFDILMNSGMDVGIDCFSSSTNAVTEHTVEEALKRYLHKPSILRTLLHVFGASMCRCLVDVSPSRFSERDVREAADEAYEKLRLARGLTALPMFINQLQYVAPLAFFAHKRDHYIVERLIEQQTVNMLWVNSRGDTVLHILAAYSVIDKQHDKEYIKMAFTILHTFIRQTIQEHCTNLAPSEKFDICRFLFLFLTRIVANHDGQSVLSYAANIHALHYLTFLLHFKVPRAENGLTHFRYALGAPECDYATWMKCEGHYDVTGLHSETMPTVFDSGGLPTTLDRFDDLVERVQTFSDITTQEPAKTSSTFIARRKFDQCLVSLCDTIVDMPINEYKCSKVIGISPLNELVEAYGERFFGAAIGLLVFHIVYMVGLSVYTLCTMSRFLLNSVHGLNGSSADEVILDSGDELMYDVSCSDKHLIVIIGFLFLIYPVVGVIVRLVLLKHSPKKLFVSSVLHIALTALFGALMLAWCLLALFCHTAQPYLLSPCLGCGWLLTTLHMSAIKQLHIFTSTLSEILVYNVSYFMAFFTVFVVAFCCATHAIVAFPPALVEIDSPIYQSVFVASKYAANLAGFYDVEPGKSTAHDDQRKAFAQYTYFGYVFVTAVILINILIAMMAESYTRVVAQKRRVWVYDNLYRAVILERAFPALFGWNNAFTHSKPASDSDTQRQQKSGRRGVLLQDSVFAHYRFRFFHLEDDREGGRQHDKAPDDKARQTMKRLSDKMQRLEHLLDSLTLALPRTASSTSEVALHSELRP